MAPLLAAGAVDCAGLGGRLIAHLSVAIIQFAHVSLRLSQVWVYPSEQMFYNAMKRKGWTPAEDDMAAVVAIHNAGERSP